MLIFRLAAFIVGFSIIVFVILSTIRTFILPRSARDKITRAVFLTVRRIFNFRLKFTSTYLQRDHIMAMYVPVTLLALLSTWLMLVIIGYILMFLGLGVEGLDHAFASSGSSLYTLGFTTMDSLPTTLLAFSEALIGMMLVALLISYLPTMYSAFARREASVTLLDVRAGSPPSALELLRRYHLGHNKDRLNNLWTTWEVWFAELEETHTSFSMLPFFRSPQPDHSWVTAAGAILDAAALSITVLDIPHDSQADLCIRAGYLALRRIAEFFRITYDPNPRPTDHISVSRAEFDDACEKLKNYGLILKPDLDDAWLHFSGWRVNYDSVLLALCVLVMSPDAPWSSDRVMKEGRVLPVQKMAQP